MTCPASHSSRWQNYLVLFFGPRYLAGVLQSFFHNNSNIYFFSEWRLIFFLKFFCYIINTVYIAQKDECLCRPPIRVGVRKKVDRTNVTVLFFSCVLWGRGKNRELLLCCQTTSTPRDKGWSYHTLRDPHVEKEYSEGVAWANLVVLTLLALVDKGWENISKVHWQSKSTLVHPQTTNTCCKAWSVAQPVLLSTLWQGTLRPLLAWMIWLSHPPCASGHAIHCIGMSNWGGPVLIHSL